VFYAICVLDLKIVKWEPAAHAPAASLAAAAGASYRP